MNKVTAIPGENVVALDLRPPAFSDEALALRFAECHADDLRYVSAWGKWLSWTGTHWQFDDTLHAFDLARRVCREAAASCNKAKVAGMLASAKTVAAVERLAKADRRIAATIDQWDADPWLLNSPDGVIDLRTGQRRAHRPDDYMTKITAIGPGGHCPRFLAFLDEITAGDAELVAYLRRVLGYALTGDTREHALFFGYGTGRNGKSVLLKTAADIMGDYHKAAGIETFTASNNDRHTTELARLRGARLVTATETEEGRRWAELRVKQLTGGDIVTARFMRQDDFEYRPQFKLVIAGNHKPSLRSVDEAIRRRFHLIPFAVTIPADQCDPELADKAESRMARYPTVAHWRLSRMAARRPKPPRAVLDATAAYLEAEDGLAAWIDDKCERAPSAWEQSTDLFASWTGWAERAGERAGTMKRFAQMLESRGYNAERRRYGRVLIGLRLAQSPARDSWNGDA